MSGRGAFSGELTPPRELLAIAGLYLYSFSLSLIHQLHYFYLSTVTKKRVTFLVLFDPHKSPRR